jgi:hypothetical protein
MADEKWSAWPAAAPLDGTEVVPVLQNGANRTVPINKMRVTVSNTAPTNPAVNDLWVDTS